MIASFIFLPGLPNRSRHRGNRLEDDTRAGFYVFRESILTMGGTELRSASPAPGRRHAVNTSARSQVPTSTAFAAHRLPHPSYFLRRFFFGAFSFSIEANSLCKEGVQASHASLRTILALLKKAPISFIFLFRISALRSSSSGTSSTGVCKRLTSVAVCSRLVFLRSSKISSGVPPRAGNPERPRGTKEVSDMMEIISSSTAIAISRASIIPSLSPAAFETR